METPRNLEQMRGLQSTSRIDNKSAVTVANLKMSTLDTQPCDLSLLQEVLQPCEILNSPCELPQMPIRFPAIGSSAASTSSKPQVLGKTTGFLDHMKGGAEYSGVLHQITHLRSQKV